MTERSGGIVSKVVARSSPPNFTVKQLARFYIKFSNTKIPVASNKGLIVLIWSKLYVFPNHSFTKINLKMIKSNIAPTVYFYHVIFSSVFVF